MSLPWFRMYAEFVDDPKIRALAFEDQRHFVVLLCLKCNGTLDTHTGTDAFRERMIAVGLGLRADIQAEVKQRLLDAGLIDDKWQPIAWDERQLLSDSGKERQRRWRERHRNVTVTVQDKDSDKDKEKNPEAKNGLPIHPKAPEVTRFTRAQLARIQATKT